MLCVKNFCSITMKIDQAITKRYQFIADALNGAGGFAPLIEPVASMAESRSYLVKYPRESTDKYARRQRIAWYRNFMHSACSKFAGYLAKKAPLREIGNPLLAAMVDDCDWRGNSLDVFWQSFVLEAKARGCMLLLVDMPRELPDNQAAQMERRAFPYLVGIAPERVISYEFNERGLLSQVAIRDTRDFGNGQAEPVTRVYGETSWWVQRGEAGDQLNIGAAIERGDHNLGACPVLAFTEFGDFPHVGSFAQIADLSRRYFNAASEQDEILRAQTFSLLTYQTPPSQTGFNVSAVAEAVGTHNMLIHQGDSPNFIAPPDGPATIYETRLEKLEADIRSIAMTVEQPSQAESGIALTIRFQELNSALTGFARQMEDLERRVFDLAGKWLGGVEPPKTIAWPKSYELADLEMEMTILQNMQAAGFPQEVIQAQMQTIISLQFGTNDPDRVNGLLDSVNAMGSEVNGQAA